MVPDFIRTEVRNLNNSFRKAEQGSTKRINATWDSKTSEVKLTLMDGKNILYVHKQKYGHKTGEAARIMSDFFVGFSTKAMVANPELAAKAVDQLPKQKA